jgi:hypothetical protein
MAEQEEKGPLEKLIDWLSGWKVSVERIRQRFGMPVAVLLALFGRRRSGLVELGRNRKASRGRVDPRALQPKSNPNRVGGAPYHGGRASRQ